MPPLDARTDWQEQVRPDEAARQAAAAEAFARMRWAKSARKVPTSRARQ
jgi:hypothetical protein